MPLDNISTSTVNGTLILQGANVGPGPLGQQLTSLAAQLKNIAAGNPLTTAIGSDGGQATTWMTMPTQQIPFAVQQGRVWHQGMKFQIGDVTVQTRGSVGFDQSLQMVAEIPIQDKWLGNSPIAGGLRGQTVQLPVTGTVTKPRVDSAALTRIPGQMLQGAASNALNQEVQGLLEKGNQQLDDQIKKGFGNWLKGGK